MVPQIAAKVAGVVAAGVGLGLGLAVAITGRGVGDGALVAGSGVVQTATSTPRSGRMSDLTRALWINAARRRDYVVATRIGPDRAPTRACVRSVEASR